MKRIPEFWYAGRSAGVASLLAPVGALYGAITLLRLERKGRRVGVPVFAIGNLTAGGAGKTPSAIALAAALHARGETPFFVTRGYGGTERGPVAVDPARHAAEQVGDEPVLLARHAPVIVARDRAAGADLAIARGASILILDDALQNPALEKDFSLCVIDGGFGLGNGRLIPAGPLRAPVGAMLPRIDAMLIIGEDRHELRMAFEGKPQFSARFVPDPSIARQLRDQRVIAFSGIGLPEKFEATLTDIGARIVASRRFGDHHRFTGRDAGELLALAHREGAQLVTTEKDAVRMLNDPALEPLRRASIALPVALALPEPLLAMIYRAIDAARSRMRIASGPA